MRGDDFDIDRRLDDLSSEYLGESKPGSPEPEPLMPSRGEQGAFPLGYLGPTLKGAVEAISTLSYVPPSLSAQSVLAACSLAVQPHVDIRLPTGQVRPTTLFLVSVAESGDRKSTSDDAALVPVREYERELEDLFAGSRAEASMAMSAWDEAKKAVTQREKNKGRQALEAAYRDLGPRPTGPVEPTIIVRSGTTQGLLKRFSTCRPSLGLMSDEGGSWLGGFGMSEDNRLMTISTLSDFWDGKTIQTMTAGEGFTAIRGRRLAFHLMVQPVIADRLLGDAIVAGQGFLSRMLVSQPPSIAGSRIVDPDAPPDPDAVAALRAYHGRLNRIIRADLRTHPDSLVLAPIELKLDEKATRLWWEFANRLEADLAPDGPLRPVKGFVGKLPEMAARLAANLAVFERGTQIEAVTLHDLTCGIGLAEFYLGEALRLFGHQAVDPIYQEAQTLSDWLRDKWDEPLISVSAISRSGPNVLRNRSDRIRDVLQVLDRHNHTSKTANGGIVSGKKVREAWRVQVRRG